MPHEQLADLQLESTRTRAKLCINKLEAYTRYGNSRLGREEHRRLFLTCEEFYELKCGASDDKGAHDYDDDRWRMAWTRQERRENGRRRCRPTTTYCPPGTLNTRDLIVYLSLKLLIFII